MKRVLTAVIDIDATPQAVWDVLTDFAAYGEWSTFSAAEGTVFNGLFWPHWNGLRWPHFAAVWVNGAGGVSEERVEVAPPSIE